MTQRRLDDFESQDLLEAIDDLDQIRGILADGPNLEPPQLRQDLMKLHKIAMRFCNEGGGGAELMELGTEIEDDIEIIRDAAERILEVLRGITEAGIEEE